MKHRARLSRLERLLPARGRPTYRGRRFEGMTDEKIDPAIDLLEEWGSLGARVCVEVLRARRRALGASLPPERRRAYRGRPPESLSEAELEEAFACLEADIGELQAAEAAAVGPPQPDEAAVAPCLRCAACRVLYSGQTIYAALGVTAGHGR